MDSQPTSSDAYTQSDTGKSGQQVGLERQGVVSEKMEDGANSLHEINVGASGNASKKTGSIKIKTSKELGSSVNHSTDPDYFDVIDTPMDFGTICSNLEQGRKYNNSEDVFRDVEYIWNNCYKYNSKGDYILDLMRQVKKNFTKYWTAAGLCNGQPRGTNGERHHKVDCLCAICVLKGHRREREENDRIAKSHGASDNSLAQELKQEESSLAESPGGNSSSDMD
ncbi:hypothetical protein ACFX12_044647 [Malus domestica]